MNAEAQQGHEFSPGIRTVGDVIAMNARLDSMLHSGVRTQTDLDDLREQLGFIERVIAARQVRALRIGFQDGRTLNGLIKALRGAIDMAERPQTEGLPMRGEDVEAVLNQ